jgi:cytochrome b561
MTATNLQVVTAAADEAQTRPHYHPIGITFHWLMAALVFVQLWWGWRTSLLAPGYDKLDAYGVHALVGIAILLLAFLRAGWRMIAPFVLPDLEKPEDLPGWQRLAAEATHVALYVLMFALPLTGWLMLSAAAPRGEIAAPWNWSLPGMPFVEERGFVERAALEQTAERLHFALVWTMMGLVALHVGAALKHHFIDRDDVLARMIPVLSRKRPRA